MNIFIQETMLDATNGGFFNESPVYKTRFTTTAEVYKFCLKEYGRCVSKVYIDDPNGKPMHIGWVFQKRAKYEACDETYIQETWVSLHEAEPIKSIEYKYWKL